MKSILIIGGGSMGAALAMRWRERFSKIAIAVIEKDPKKRAKLKRHGIQTSAEVTGACDILVLAIKPQQAAACIASLTAKKHKAALVVSVMAGVPLARFKALGTHAARIMPNTPCLIGEGMSVIYAPKLPSAKRQNLTRLFEAVGKVTFVAKEEALHAVTALSGSGPAYVFAFMEALAKAGETMGLSRQLSRTLVAQTVKGSALLADAHSGEVTPLRIAVTSPGGTTEAALKHFTKLGLSRMVQDSVKTAMKRSKQLSK